MSRMRALLRIARRDAARARGRSALIALMIALPVVSLTLADVLARTAQPDPDEVVSRRLGATQYVLEAAAPIGSGLLQAPDPLEGTASVDSEPSREPPRFADPATLIPAGGRVLNERSASVQLRTRRGIGEIGWTEVDAADPAFGGRYLLLSGRAPRGRSEVLVTPEVLERTGARIGDTLVVADPPAEVKVSGTMRQAGTLGEQTVYATPGTLIGRRGGIPARSAASLTYVADAAPLDWAQVLRLNEQGVTAYDRSIAIDPPPRSRVPYYEATAGNPGNGADRTSLILALAVVLALSLLEVVLLAGAAFMVGARRQARSLALVAATGGTTRDVGVVVLAGGVVLGVVAATVGVVTGVLGAAAARPLLANLTQTPFARFDVRPLELLAIATVGLLAGLLAAVVPARLAARQDVVAALAGRRGQVATGRRMSVIGLAIAATGILLAFGGSLWAAAHAATGGSDSQTRLLAAIIAGGAVLSVIGLVVVSPAVLGLASRLGSRLPLPGRLALRDAARHRGRSAPAMSAVLAAVAGSAALALYVSALDDHDRRVYVPVLPTGNAGAGLETFVSSGPRDTEPDLVLRDAAPVIAAGERHLPVARTTVVQQSCSGDKCQTASLVTPAANQCPVEDVDDQIASAERDDWRCRPGTFAGGGGFGSSGFVVGDAEDLKRLYAIDDERAARVLATGGVVTFSRTTVLDGRAQFDVLPAGALASGDLSVERGYTSEYGLGLLALALAAAIITLGAAGIATGLAQADGRADHATLAAVGADPRLRRTLAACQALVIAGLGAGLGTAVGFVPAVSLIGAVQSLELAVPWVPLAGLIVGLPLLAAVAAWTLTRSSPPMDRRREA